MIKFTFITLVMILGISSVSFGNSYLCIPERGTLLSHNKNYIITKQSEFNKNKFLVKTYGNNRKMISVKFFGEDWYICKVGEKYIDGGEVLSGVGESIKGGDTLTCRQPHRSEEGGYTKKEFILDFKKNQFHYYSMNVTSIKMGSIFSVKCEEI